MKRKWRLAFAALLKAGTDIEAWDRDGATALMRAAGGGHVEIVKALLAAGADVHARNRGGKGKSALDIAREHKRTDAIALLEKAGAK